MTIKGVATSQLLFRFDNQQLIFKMAVEHVGEFSIAITIVCLTKELQNKNNLTKKVLSVNQRAFLSHMKASHRCACSHTLD